MTTKQTTPDNRVVLDGDGSAPSMQVRVNTDNNIASADIAPLEIETMIRHALSILAASSAASRSTCVTTAPAPCSDPLIRCTAVAPSGTPIRMLDHTRCPPIDHRRATPARVRTEPTHVYSI